MLRVSVPGQHLHLFPAHSGTCWGPHRHEGWQHPAFPPSRLFTPSPGENFNSSILGFSPPGTPRSFVIPVLDLGTEKHARLPGGRSCLGCPRFGNLEALLLPGAPAALAWQLRKPSSTWRVVLGVAALATALPGELPSGTSTQRKQLFPFPGRGSSSLSSGGLAG